MDKVKVTFEITKVGEDELILIPSTEWVVDNVRPGYIVLSRARHIGQTPMISTKK